MQPGCEQTVIAVPGIAPDTKQFHSQDILTCLQKGAQIRLIRIAALIISLAWAEAHQRAVDVELIPAIRRNANRPF